MLQLAAQIHLQRCEQKLHELLALARGELTFCDAFIVLYVRCDTSTWPNRHASHMSRPPLPVILYARGGWEEQACWAEVFDVRMRQACGPCTQFVGANADDNAVGGASLAVLAAQSVLEDKTTACGESSADSLCELIRAEEEARAASAGLRPVGSLREPRPSSPAFE